MFGIDWIQLFFMIAVAISVLFFIVIFIGVIGMVIAEREHQKRIRKIEKYITFRH